MKYTKTAVALAIAGMAAAPMIASADTTLSGAVQLRLSGNDSPGDAGDARITPGDVLVGVQTSHELNSGLTGYGSLRIDLDRLSNAQTTIDEGDLTTEDDDVRIGTVGTADSVYVGFKGAFGDIRIGEVPNAVELGQVSTDIFDVASEDNGGISYTGGFGPATIIAQFSPEQNNDIAGLGIKFGFAGFNVGIGGENRADNNAFAVGASYAFSGASIAAHYWSRETGGAAGDIESFSVKLGYGFGGVSASIAFTGQETDSGDPAIGTDEDGFRFDIGYGLGGGMDVSARVQNVEDNFTGDDGTSWRIQLSKTF